MPLRFGTVYEMSLTAASVFHFDINSSGNYLILARTVDLYLGEDVTSHSLKPSG
jgi:hypothetical protein